MRRVLPLFIGSIFLGAFLLFLVQPLVTRMLMPHFGGSPAVWNTALVFFQSVLLLGYLYAHGLVRAVPGRWQLAVHLPVLALPLILLPPGLPAGLDPTGASWPGLTVLATLALVVGAPFFVLATNSSLIQHWWAGSGRSDDPYWLYGTSNLGSLLALLAYPFLVEPAFDLASQSRLWSAGYGLFVLLTAGAMVTAHRAYRPRSVGASDATEPPRPARGSRSRPAVAPVTPVRRGLWVVRAAVATSLLLSITMRITTDVASVPLFWVVPLALYLLTFILAFSLTDRLPRRPLEAGTVLALAAAAGLLPVSVHHPFELVAAVNLVALFVGALLCHRDLAADRPDPDHLTGFYLWISFGGALGGILNSLVAPVVFDTVAEYPLTLVAVALLLHMAPGDRRLLTPFLPSRLVAVAAGAALVLPLALHMSGDPGAWARAGVVGLALLWGLALSRYVGFVVLSVAAAGAIHFAGSAGVDATLATERSFFGVVRVRLHADTVTMVHGTTTHGRQIRDPALRRTPGSYYHPEGPMGAAVLEQPPEARIGVVGLGAGSLAALLEPGQEMVYHEIDPLVVEMARAHFTYLDESEGDVSVVLGDGRLTLERVPDGPYDLLVIDAFSSDFVPTHLLTVEALELYRSRVRSGGLVLLHISNRHADLRRVIKGYSTATGHPVAYADHSPSLEARREGASRSLVAAVAADPGTIDELIRRPGWVPTLPGVEPVTWTDRRVDLPAVLR